MRASSTARVVYAAGLAGLCSCTAYHLEGVRPAYPQEAGKLEISCATLPATDEGEINNRLSQLYDAGWRLAATGSQRGFSANMFLCFERPAKARPPKAKPAPPPPPPAEEAAPEESEEAPKTAPPPAKKKAAPAPAASPDDSSDDQADQPPPPPKKKKHNPLMDDQ